MISVSEIILRLFLASLFGALIGLERERKHWAAGMRTHMLVCVGSCLMMMVSAFGFSDILGNPDITLDPSRIAAQVVTGIGFIGAGAILFSKNETIRGLTTAAGIWTVAGIGLATGGGMVLAAAITTGFAIIILWGLQPLEKKYFEKFKQKSLRITTSHDFGNAEFLTALLKENGIVLISLNFTRTNEDLIFQIQLEHADTETLESVINLLKKNSAIKEIQWLN
ncbi:MAG TPA: MgtC/SapB family protein [Bacteroidia bacterium]|jgi:putative Mg2+ transporter-C (MgtC) family protein|nr:MgtC/SapB family protein [Bacteroidia bacterium]HMU18993.1 MgtC/SapB family protein [Bacteroidia bacterium]